MAQPSKAPAGKLWLQWTAIRWELIAAAVSLVLVAWIVTEGDWNFFPAGGLLEGFYDAQADSLLQGRLDVRPDSIGPEAFVRNGKSYGYFGPTPALARVPLNVIAPSLEGHWNRISMCLASVVVIGMLLLLWRRLEQLMAPRHDGLWRALGAVLIVAAAVGSTNYVVSAESKVYQESIAWGSALAFAHAVLLLSWLMTPARKWLVLSCLTAFFAFFARVSSGAGPIFALFVLDLSLLAPSTRFARFWGAPSLPSRRAATMAFSTTIAATAVLWGVLNYAKFGTVFTSQPMALNAQYDAARLQRIKGSLFSIGNVPVTVWAYFSPSNVKFTGRFPWVNFVAPDRGAVAARFPAAHLDSVEPFASLPAGMPELLLAALFGTVLCLGLRRKELAPMRAPLVGAIVGCGLIFTWGLITYRYLHDLFPWLAIGSAAALACIPSIEKARMRHVVAVLFVLGAAYSIGVNFWFGVLQQRWYAMPVLPEKRLAFLDLGREVDEAGFRGLRFNLTHWRGYIPASSMEGGNLVVDLQFAERRDHPVAHSVGQSPSGGEYSIDVPEDGNYNLAIRYASPDSRPVSLFLNRREYGQVCASPTGGSAGQFQAWAPVASLRLPRGLLHIGLASYGEFPNISMLRLVRLD
jgi:hypothetical protein